MEELAELCSPLSFKRGEALPSGFSVPFLKQVLFSRGEPCTWLGLLLAGRCFALLPGVLGAQRGELRLGEHEPGEVLGLARAALWERSHVRTPLAMLCSVALAARYTLRAIEDGCIAVLSLLGPWLSRLAT